MDEEVNFYTLPLTEREMREIVKNDYLFEFFGGIAC